MMKSMAPNQSVNEPASLWAGRIPRPVSAASKNRTRRLLISSSLMLCFAFILLWCCCLRVEAANGAGSQPEISKDYNRLENLISEFLDDAGDRLKKSRTREPMMPTLRFGRSDRRMAQAGHLASLADELRAGERQFVFDD